MIPQVEPDLSELEAQAAYEVVLSGWVNEGKLSDEFARKFAETVGAEYAIPTTSCTAALSLALMALEIHGKEVIVPDITMIGTAMAVKLSGNTPVLVDVRPEDACLDAEAVKKAINSQTGAIIPVHVNGRNGISSELQHVATANGLPIVEDAACCLGSTYQCEAPVQLGTTGSVGCFSLAATKIITTGQGGVMVTNDPNIYEKLTRLKDWGRFENKGTTHPALGFNFKFNDIQAAIALKQLERLPKLVDRKKQIYNRYKERLNDLMFSTEDHAGFCPWYVDIKGQDFVEPLRQAGIGTTPIWPALHQQGAMEHTYRDDEFPTSTALAQEILWMPSSTKITDNQIDYICDVIGNLSS